MNAEIVPLSKPYFRQMRQVLDIVAREKRFLALTEAPPEEECFAFYRGLIESQCPMFIALVDEQVVGWCDIQFSFGQTRRHVGTLGMGLLPAYRGGGIGTELIQSALKAARANGLSRIELTVRTDNDVARKLYERIGFEHEGIKRRSMLVDGIYYDVYAMALVRDPDDQR